MGHAQTVATHGLPASRVNAALVTVDIEQVPLKRALEAIAQQAGLTPFYGAAVTQAPQRVTLHVKKISVVEAFEQALRGTGVRAMVTAGNVIFERDGTTIVAQGTGSIAGRVVEANTKRPLRGATVLLDDAAKGIVTSDDGTFRFAEVAVGTHRVTVRLLGYVREVKTVAIAEGMGASVEVVLAQGTNTLDQVVVTGTIIPTERKAVPNAMTVITAKDIEQRGITKINQLFRGDVPGVFVLNIGSASMLDDVTMFSRGSTDFSASGAAIKTYVDGVELADPKYLSQIDPQSIERIEILTGPQASTIYGSNAINGVMQIFTKRGTSNTPQLTLNLQSGWVESSFSNTRTPQHDDDIQINGIEGRLSYSAGGSWNYVGPWTPAKQTARLGASGGARLDIPSALGAVTTDVTFRRTKTTNQQHGFQAPRWDNYYATGWYGINVSADPTGAAESRTYGLTGQTLGLIFSYVPTSWWSHELGFGQDASDTEQRQATRWYRYVSDTTLNFTQTHTDRRSLRYATTIRIPVTSGIQATAILGSDAWQQVTMFTSVSPQTLTGTLSGSSSITRQPGHNTGAFLQTQLGVGNRLFLTYGLRAEWNPNFGKDAEPNYTPRYGVAYTADIGMVTAKLRGSYGQATRPPIVGQKQAQRNTDNGLTAVFGPYNTRQANADLGPEYQKGGEGGLELYLGERASLVITRYNQTVDGLIIAVPGADSVRSLQPNPLFFGLFTCADIIPARITQWCSSQDAAGYAYALLSQNLNVGSIRNQGWELQGSVNTGPFTTKGTYSWTKSRVIGITPQFRDRLPRASYPQYQPGATFQLLPEHTWAFGTTYAHARTTLSMNVTGNGQLAAGQNEFYTTYLSSNIRLQQNRLHQGVSVGYYGINQGYTLTDINASQRFSSSIEGILQVQNLTDHSTDDYFGAYVTMGRQVKAGLRLRLQ